MLKLKKKYKKKKETFMKFFTVIRDLGITLALAISFPLCVHLGINVFYPEFQKLHKWDDKKEFLSPSEYKEYMNIESGSKNIYHHPS